MYPRFAIAASLLAAACSEIVPSTVARLASVDPLAADPAALELVVILPPGLAVTPGTATLEIGAVRGEDTAVGSFRLEDRRAPEGIAVREGATARGFALSASDAQRMRELQEQIDGWKRDGSASGSFGFGLGGCTIGNGPAPDATGSVLIRMTADGTFLPLIREGRLSELLGPKVLAAIKPCQGAE
ncbi:hypothetical protein [Tabrizicola sp.]|uniref:hypothetical protein n=1 Tax=Tabrizicola sp. TaxID=2005166 RepID=UPI002732D323|nr:hypothetical protein [Tabrizicola sp.]MDP3195961.1 hypothetical protein [Tabrizicola sp.]